MSLISSVSGDIEITGTGGSGTGEGNRGVKLAGTSRILSTGTDANAARIRIEGHGGVTGTDRNDGVLLTFGTEIRSVFGDVSVVGVGGTGSGFSNAGIALVQSTIASSGGGDNAAAITFNGTAGTGTNSNWGIVSFNTTVSSAEGDILFTGVGGASTGDTNRAIEITSESVIESTGTGSNAASIRIDGRATSGNNFSDGVFINDATLRSIDGNIDITGVGADGNFSNTGVAIVDASITSSGTDTLAAEITVSGTGGVGVNNNRGVVALRSTISSVDGRIAVTGNGNGSGNNNEGIEFSDNSVIQSTGTTNVAATITLNGQGASGTGFNRGILLEQSTVSTVMGDVLFTGKGGDGSGDSNYGVAIEQNMIVESTGTGPDAGKITAMGTGGAGVNWNVGTTFSNGGIIRSVDGDISLTGHGGAGTGANNRGVSSFKFDGVRSTGTGTNAAEISIVGVGGSGTNGSAGGFLGGDLSAIESVDGAISISGNSGLATTGFLNGGIWVGVNVRSFGDAPIDITGVGGSDVGTNHSHGVDIAGVGTEIFSQNSQIRITGQGGDGTEDNNRGVRVHKDATVHTVDGNVAITGTAGHGVSHGIQIRGDETSGASVFASDSGAVLLRAFGNEQADALSIQQNVTIGSPTQLDDVLLVADSIQIHESAVIQSNGSLRIQTPTDGTSIGLGGAPGTLQLDDSEIATFQPGFLRRIHFGSPSDLNSINIDSVVFHDAVSLSGGQIIHAASGVDIQAPSIDLFGDIHTGGNAGSPLVPGILEVDGDVTLGQRVLNISFAGATAGEGGQHHGAVHASGSMDVFGVLQLHWIPSWQPAVGDVLTIVQRDGGRGAFDGLPEGSILPDFFNATISYVGGDGDDITLTIPQSFASTRTILLNDLGFGTTIQGSDADDNAGQSVNSAGDVNNDGYDDFLIGASMADSVDNARANAGEAYLIYGGPNLPATIDLSNLGEAGVVIYGVDPDDEAGHVVDGADINNDGFSDIVITANRSQAADNALFIAGGAYIIWGSDSLPETIDLSNLGAAGVTIHGADHGDLLGTALAAIGDLNSDGFEDIALGAIWADSVGNNRNRAGEIQIIWGSNSLPEVLDLATADDNLFMTIFGADDVDELGIGIRPLGDINGDDIDDVIVTAWKGDGPEESNDRAGESYILYGAASLGGDIDLAEPGAADVIIYGVDVLDMSGSAVGGGGDVNGDGLNDFLIAASRGRGPDNDDVFRGESYLIFGSESLPAAIDLSQQNSAAVTIYGVEKGDYSGESVEIVGDLNSDGYDDIAIGARAADGIDGSLRSAGETSIVMGRATWPTTLDLSVPGAAAVMLYGTDSDDESGFMVRGAGDVDNDGQPDLIIGARFADSLNNSRANAGQAHLIRGNSLFNLNAPPKILAPLGTSTEIFPTYTWAPVQGATSYELWVGLIAGDNNPVLSRTVTGTELRSPFPLSFGRYRMWVRGVRPDGSKSDWGINTFAVTASTTLHDLPFHGTNATPTISWNPVDGSIGYRVFITNTTTRQNGFINTIVTDTSYTPPSDLTFGRHRIWVRPIGIGNYEGSWSTGEEYYIGPQPESPVGATLDPQPQFSWSNIEGAATHQIYLIGPGGVLANESEITGTTFTPDTALPNGDFRWWIRGFTADGTPGPWSEAAEFSTGGRTKITTPLSFMAGNIPNFDWAAVPNARSYEIYISKVGTPGALYRTAGVTDNSYKSPPLNNGDYRVWIRTTLADGSSVWGQGVAFTIDQPVTDITTSVTQPTTSIFDSNPRFVWQQGNGAKTYDFYLLNNDPTVEASARIVLRENIQFTDTTVQNLPAGDWTWWVRTRDPFNVPGPWSHPGRFSNDGRVTVISFSLSGNNVPGFGWQAIPGAGRYAIQVDNLTTGETKVIREDNLTDPFFTSPTGFAAGTYRAWVRAISTGGSIGPWSVPSDFTIT